MNNILVKFRCNSTSSTYSKNQRSTYAVNMGDNVRTDIKMLCQVQFHSQSIMIYSVSVNEGKTGLGSRVK
jgi:hypothetical protein